ncbi:protein PLANT CADMIUM RESISTANCE 12-like [Impatiens glandulifera]|uniref:protein PLANT CADMIUM RESISTANCE 12-like n=1 Tax=Impatiens glandulifera TaxID=253017 RepID=UPI001FB1052C|nr:protein PLANT CADMIUM RESISTANCE 12-like [Impatiens glandulifera]
MKDLGVGLIISSEKTMSENGSLTVKEAAAAEDSTVAAVESTKLMIPFQPYPNPTGLPEGQWTTGLYDCLDDRHNCLMTAFCPWVTLGQNAHVIDRGTISCFAAGAIYAALIYAGCNSMYGCTYRAKLRGYFSLPEAPLPDGIVHCICFFCALCQDYRELKNRGIDPSVSWEANVENWMDQKTTLIVPPTTEPGMER